MNSWSVHFGNVDSVVFLRIYFLKVEKWKFHKHFFFIKKPIFKNALSFLKHYEIKLHLSLSCWDRSQIDSLKQRTQTHSKVTHRRPTRRTMTSICGYHSFEYILSPFPLAKPFRECEATNGADFVKKVSQKVAFTWNLVIKTLPNMGADELFLHIISPFTTPFSHPQNPHL